MNGRNLKTLIGDLEKIEVHFRNSKYEQDDLVAQLRYDKWEAIIEKTVALLRRLEELYD